VLRPEHFLDENCSRTAAKDICRCVDVAETAGDRLKSHAAMFDKIALALRRDKVASALGHPGHDIHDLDARAASNRERYRLFECWMVGGAGIDIDKNAFHGSHRSLAKVIHPHACVTRWRTVVAVTGGCSNRTSRKGTFALPSGESVVGIDPHSHQPSPWLSSGTAKHFRQLAIV
jgi:hypothetical protein